MRKLILLLTLILAAISLNAQVPRPTRPKQPAPPTVPPPEIPPAIPAPDIFSPAKQESRPDPTEVLTIRLTPDSPCIAVALDLNVQVAVAKQLASSHGVSTFVSEVSLKDWTFTACVVKKIQQNRFTLPAFLWNVIHSNEINAFADPSRSTVTVYDALLHFMNYNEDEIAAVIAHEIGHLQDFRMPIGPGEVRCTPGTRMAAWDLQKCEAKADYLGLQYLLGAGYNGFGMAGELGRFLVYQGDTGLRGFLMRFTSDHPINIDRLKAVRTEWIELCQKHSLACQNTAQ